MEEKKESWYKKHVLLAKVLFWEHPAGILVPELS